MALVIKSQPANAGDITEEGFIPESGRSLGEGHGSLLPAEPHGQGSLASHGPLGRTESALTERAHTEENLETTPQENSRRQASMDQEH